MKLISLFRNLFLLTILTGISACTSEERSAIPTIPIDPTQNEINCFLSDIVDDISVVHLETNQNCLLGQYPWLNLVDDHYTIVSSDNKLYFFDNQGNYLNTLDAQGNGPEEYRSLMVSVVDPVDETFYVVEDTRLMSYAFSGEYIGTSNLPFRAAGAFRLSDGQWIITGFQYYDKEDRDLLYLLNPDLSIKKIFKSRNPDVITDTPQRFWYYVNPYKIENRVFIKEMFVDTIYKLMDTSLVPHWIMDYGEYKIPTKIGIDPVAQDKSNDRIPEMAYRESAAYFFMEYYYDYGAYYCVFNKQKRKYLFQHEYRQEDFPEGVIPSLGIENDLIENAPRFWPNYVHNNTLVSIIHPASLNKDQLAAFDCKIDDNPVLIIGRCK